jgi:hypothetical protein
MLDSGHNFKEKMSFGRQDFPWNILKNYTDDILVVQPIKMNGDLE